MRAMCRVMPSYKMISNDKLLSILEKVSELLTLFGCELVYLITFAVTNLLNDERCKNINYLSNGVIGTIK